MDDFNGKFCKNGSFPVIRAVSDCFKKKVNPSCLKCSEMKNCFNCFKLKLKKQKRTTTTSTTSTSTVTSIESDDNAVSRNILNATTESIDINNFPDYEYDSSSSCPSLFVLNQFVFKVFSIFNLLYLNYF